MRVGFVTQLLWPRYGPLWQRLVAELGAEPRVAAAALVRERLADPRLAGIPGLAFRLAAAEAIVLGDCELLLVPDLNPASEAGRGGGQDPWIASFPSALANSVSGLPPLLAVPAGKPENLDQLVLETLARLARDPRQARLVWQRHRAALRADQVRPLPWPVAAAGHQVVGLVGQPWLLSDAVAAAVAGAAGPVVAQHRFDPLALRHEGRLHDAGLLPTDLEVLGAARLFARRGAVAELRLLADRDSGGDAWLLRRIGQQVRKPVTASYLQDFPDPVALLQEGAEG